MNVVHKNSQQLLSEISEILKELEVYASQKGALSAYLGKLSREYERGEYGYLEYEGKQKAALKGRSSEEWADYYRAYMFSLLKKAEFILAQVYAIVQDDYSFDRLQVKGLSRPQATEAMGKIGKAKAATPVAPAAMPASKPAHAAMAAAMAAVSVSKPEQRVEVFNIDNELARLKALLASRRPSPGQLEKVEEALGGAEAAGAMAEAMAGKVRLVIPRFEELTKAVEGAERNVAREAVKAAREAAKKVAKAAKVAGAAEKGKGAPSAPAPLANIFAHFTNALKSAAQFRHKRNVQSGIVRFAAVVRSATASLKLAASKAVAKLQLRKAKAVKVQALTAKPAVQPAAAKAIAQKQGVFSALKQLVLPGSAKKGIFVEEIVAMEKQAKAGEKLPIMERKETAGLAFGWFSAKGMINEFTEKFRSKQEPVVGERTAVPMHLKKLKEMRKRIYDEEKLSSFDATLLAQEARRVKKIMEVEKPEVYQGSSVGLIANLTVRKISLFLVDNFSEFFGFLYNALRSANVKVLSNTYVNIMILSTIFVMGVSFIILLPLFFMLSYPLYQIVLRSTIFSLIAGFACATIFYAYPFMKINERKRKIMTNMPFAINHMAAVATSGVPPASMFELIASSKEYSEIGIEVKKIVDFIGIFGYDLLTAVRTVAATTPSQPFKEFLEGIVSTIETGGDLDRYLRQEADQAALTYNLERQRYNETVSTYSDIYTGLLIAAPLFFVAAMALVNLLGGTLGGIGVDVVMAVGAYVVIPLLNVGFLAFLQMTQPEV